jgi:hypothetical protein
MRESLRRCVSSGARGDFILVELAMLSPGEIALIKAEIARLEKARKECRDSGIQKQIDIWIEELKKRLLS